MRNKLPIVTLFLSIFLALCFSAPTHAISIKKVADYKVKNGTGNTGWHSQGATMSKDYYIWTDWQKSDGPTYIVMCKRSNTSDCWRSKKSYNYGHASTLYHKWSTDYFIVKAGSEVKACWSISQKKAVSSSKCSSIAKEVKFGKVITNTHATAQGYTKYGNYYLRSYGNTPGANYITLFNSNFKKVKDVKLPNSINEVEDVMVDGDTGYVYFSSVQYVNGKKHVQFYKLPNDTFSKWLKPGADGSAGSAEQRTATESAAKQKTSSDSSSTSTPSASTYDGVISTIFFGTIQDDGGGCGVYTILDLVMTILTIGIGAAALIGIAISGITYLTAGSNLAKTTKAKRRILEIVIGLAAYAVIWAVLTFILPEFNPELKTCKTLTSAEIAARNAEKAAQKQSQSASQQSTSSTNSTSDSDLSKWYQAYTEQAKYMKNTKYGSNYKSDFKKSKTNGTCITYVSTSLQRLGVIPKNTYVWYSCGMTGTAKKYIKNRKDVFQVTYPNKTVKQLYEKGKIQKGDIVFYQYGSKCGVGHTMIFVGFNKKGKPIFNSYGHIGMKTNYAHSDGSRKVNMLIHLKKTSLNTQTSTNNASTSDQSTTNSTHAEKVAQTAEELSWPLGTDKSKWAKCYDSCKKTSASAAPYGNSKTLAGQYNVTANLYDCGGFVQLVTTVVNGQKTSSFLSAALKSYSNFSSIVAKYNYKAIKWDGKVSSLKRGDIVVYKYKDKDAQHIYVYLGNNLVANANYTPGDKKYFSHITKAEGNLIKTSNKKFVYIARPQ